MCIIKADSDRATRVKDSGSGAGQSSGQPLHLVVCAVCNCYYPYRSSVSY